MSNLGFTFTYLLYVSVFLEKKSLLKTAPNQRQVFSHMKKSPIEEKTGKLPWLFSLEGEDLRSVAFL